MAPDVRIDEGQPMPLLLLVCLYACMLACLYACMIVCFASCMPLDISSKGGKLSRRDGTGRIVWWLPRHVLRRHSMPCHATPRHGIHTSTWPDGRSTSSRSIYATDPSSRLALYPCSRLFIDRCSSRPPQQVVGRLESNTGSESNKKDGSPAVASASNTTTRHTLLNYLPRILQTEPDLA